MVLKIMNNKILLTLPSFNDQGGVASFFNSVLIHTHNTHIAPLEIGGSKRAGNHFHPLNDQLRYYFSLRQIQPGLVHLNPSLNFKSFFRDGLLAFLAAKRKIPFLVFWHGWNNDFEKKVQDKYLWFFRKTFGKASGFIVLSSEFKNKLIEWEVNAPIYLGTTCVDDALTQGINPCKKWEHPEEISCINVLFLARLEKEKGIYETIDAIKILHNKGYKIRLTIAGDGLIKNDLEQHVKTLEFPPKTIQFTGDIRGNEKIKVFNSHHLFCFPTSYGEGLPTSVLEAMAFGQAIVTRPVGGLKDMFEHKKMGRLVQSKSPLDIANHMEKLISDTHKLACVGKYNALYAKNNYMASQVAVNLQSIYQAILTPPDEVISTTHVNSSN